MNPEARAAQTQGPVPGASERDRDHRESTPAVPATRHVAHIDGLRAIAVLAVIAYHLDPRWLPGGFAGVDVFFAISGFVVAASVHGWREGGFGSFIGYFYARRMQRIVPALLACLLLTSIASALLIPSLRPSQVNELTALHAVFGLANWYLANQREAYFAPTSEFNPYAHTWSLGVEEQFYLLFPLLFFAWTRGLGWRVLSSGLVAIALVVSLAIAMRLARSDPTGAIYLIQSRLWELASGVLLFQALALGHRMQARGGRNLDLLARGGAWLSLGMLAWGLATSNPRAFPWPGAWLPVLGTLGVIAFLHAREGGVLRAALGSAPMAAIGRLSYSLYLWHWPVFVLLRWTIGLDSIAARAIGLAATFALATASYLVVERPLRYSATLQMWPRQGVVAAAILLACCAWAITLQLFELRPAFALTTVSRNSADWHAVPGTALPDVPGCRLLLEYDRKAGGLQVMSRVGCAAPAHRAPTVFALGDSHATGYMTLFGEHVLRTGARVVAYHNPGCTFASLQPHREGGACPAQGKAAIVDILSRAQPGDVVLLAALRLTRFSNQFAATNERAAWRSMTGPAATAARLAAERALPALLEPLAAHGLHIVLEAPKPLLRAPPFRCSDAFNASNPICAPGLTIPRKDIERYRAPVLESFSRLAARMPAISIWDPLPELCPGSTCGASMQGKPLYFDGDHLSAYGNRLLLPSFTRHLAAITAAGPDGRNAP
ncbi:MAG: acyltransferase [Lysobacteraceae bacterium]|nr:MAG: acyltransferase [Xanthomonadaceae bacterium]